MRGWNTIAWRLAGMALVLATGCQAESPPPPATDASQQAEAPVSPQADENLSPSEAPSSEPPAVPVATPEAAAEVSLVAVDLPAYRQVLEKKQGKVVLVDVWATWCAPCKKAFPHTVELSRKYGPQGLEVVSLSFDDEAAHEDALAFLKEQQATFTNLRSVSGASDDAVEKFEIDNGGLPHLKLYSRDGKLVKKFISGDPDALFSPEDVELAVRELLTKE